MLYLPERPQIALSCFCAASPLLVISLYAGEAQTASLIFATYGNIHSLISQNASVNSPKPSRVMISPTIPGDWYHLFPLVPATAAPP